MKANGQTTGLSDGYVVRPATLEDAEAVASVLNAASMDQIGVREWETRELVNDWQNPLFDLEGDTRVVMAADGSAAAYADVWDEPPHVRVLSIGQVHPEHRGRGIGTELCRWLKQRAGRSVRRAPEGARVVLSQILPSSDKIAGAHLMRHGFRPVRYHNRMSVELNRKPAEPVVPPGISIRTSAPGEVEDVLQAVREEFRDHWGYVETPWETALQDWQHWIQNDPDYDPSLWFLAIADGQIVGTSLCRPRIPEDPEMGWVHALGVRRRWRRRGIALALLHRSFNEFCRRGKQRVGLGVDAGSLTGAMRLYEKAGMRVVRTYVSYEQELRPGVELRTQTILGQDQAPPGYAQATPR